MKTADWLYDDEDDNEDLAAELRGKCLRHGESNFSRANIYAELHMLCFPSPRWRAGVTAVKERRHRGGAIPSPR